MIRIENINIAFDCPLIEHGVLEIYPGQLTLVQGESGCGKSSLLSVAGLLRDFHQEVYHFNDKTIRENEIIRAEFRKKHIGYVFQDKSLFDHLSIYENMALYTEVSGEILTKEKAKSILAQVRLNMNLDREITTLSGGEKQRLAIACALCKNPELLILDEPTSALDSKNAHVILEILRKLASQGKMIMIASHDASLIEACDTVYTIANGQLKKVRELPNKLSPQKMVWKKHKVSLRFYFSYYKSFFQKNIVNQIVMLLICGLCVAVMIAERNVSKGYEEKQLSHIDALLGKEIFVTSQADGKGSALYYQGLPAISEITLKRIQNLAHFQEMYPYYEINVTSINDVNIRCIIQPYTKYKPIADYLFEGKLQEDGIYITASLEKMFARNQMLDQPVNIEGLLPDGSTYVFNNVQVDGILDKDYHNDYSYVEEIVFLPIEMMPEQENIQALLVYSDHYDSTNELKENIREQNMDLGLFTAFRRTTEGNNAMANIKSFIKILTIVVVLLSILLIGLIYSSYMTNRELEICLLRVNGLSKKEVMKLIMTEMIVQTFIMSCISLIFVCAGYNYFHQAMKISIQNRWLLDIARSFFYAFLLMFFPNMLSLFIYQRLDMASALRTD